jgi:hypothetical protein
MLTFRHALEAAGVNSAEVCVLRHQDARADPGRTPYSYFSGIAQPLNSIRRFKLLKTGRD